jgi:ATP-dependent Clp protease ATP-binding subunit ClpA
MAAKIRGHLPSQSPITDPTIKLPMNSEAAAILTQAKKEAETANNKTIDTEHLLSALIKSNTAGKNFLIFFAFNLPAIEKMVQDKKQEAKDSVAAGCGVNPSTTLKGTTAAKLLDKAVAACGAAASIAGAVSDAMKNVKNPKNNPGVTRVEWIEILDKAIGLSKKTGISVPSCFIQVAMSEQSTIDRTVAGQIRIDAIQDLIQSLSNQQKNNP